MKFKNKLISILLITVIVFSFIGSSSAWHRLDFNNYASHPVKYTFTDEIDKWVCVESMFSNFNVYQPIGRFENYTIDIYLMYNDSEWKYDCSSLESFLKCLDDDNWVYLGNISFCLYNSYLTRIDIYNNSFNAHYGALNDDC